ncbi:MAG: branched-chain amino acid ABC transporter permease [Desulfobacteraceae bacterium]|nr:branched-chain amino acid ABC transporter permease [Desulfobacteraceae bacterium]
MSAIVEHLVIGIAVGSVYSIVALGFVLIYKATGIFNLAQGSLMCLGAYVCYVFSITIGLPFYLAVILTLAAAFALGLLIEFIFLRRMIGQPHLSILMVTIGMYLMIRGIVLIIWGVYSKSLPPYLPTEPVTVLGANVLPIFIVGLMAAAILFTVFILFFKFTSIGVAMRATQDNQQVAQSVGISVRRVFGVSWAIASLTAAAGGIIVGTILSVGYLLDDFGFKVLPAVILGGLESIPGALIGGLVLGVAEHFGAAYLGSWLIGIEDVIPYIILLALLLIAPYGIFGLKRIKRI